MALALYRKYRSKSLDEIVGQSHITTILSKAIQAGHISHAYLLTGPRGVGKTSVARILAHEINHLPYDEAHSHLDIIEIDAASNNGVEDVRDLREKVQIAPVSADKKVYIIDEVHMLSKAAFNALLKTLEEPPEHVVFILATTDVDKLPATIISRTQRFGFRAIAPEDAVTHLKKIAEQESIKITDEAVTLIAQLGEGSFRDSISLLDQLSSLADSEQGITAELVETTLGLASHHLLEQLLEAVEHHDAETLNALLLQAQSQGMSGSVIAKQLALLLRGRLAQKPQFVSLLDSLLDVPKSSQPDIKLLTVLLAATLPKQPPKTAALKTPVLEISARVDELVHPKSAAPLAPKVTPSKEKIKKETSASTPAETVVVSVPAQPFEWTSFVEYLREHFVAIYSVMSKCHYDLHENELTIFTHNAFYKKKLDDTKYSSHLYDSLTALGFHGLTVITVPTAPPPKDSQAAAVAAIMGGGEEVSLEESEAA